MIRSGAGKSVWFRLHISVYRLLQKKAEENGCSLSSYVSGILEKELIRAETFLTEPDAVEKMAFTDIADEYCLKKGRAISSVRSPVMRADLTGRSRENLDLLSLASGKRNQEMINAILVTALNL